MNNNALLQKIIDFQSWLWGVNLKSSDPFALQCNRTAITIGRISPRYIPFVFSQIDMRFPQLSNTFIPHAKASHSAGLYVQACLLMSKTLDDISWKSVAETELMWLLSNYNRDYTGYTWGVPFPWLMGYSTLAPENTPLSTVSPYSNDAFVLAGNTKVGLSIAEMIMTDLKVTHQDGDKICMSYSPLDNFQIINANAYSAAQLYRAYHRLGISRYKERADKMVNFILSEQNEDGSWYYWSSHQRVNEGIDSLHQCYVMQGLQRVWLVNKDVRIKRAIEKCRKYIGTTFIDEQFLIRKFPKQHHPYELMDAAEMVVTLDMLGEHEVARTILDATTTRFSLPEKPYFASRLNPTTKIPFIRWGESQMFYAMALHYALEEKAVTIPEVYL